jgi:hypothetical protein
MQTSAADGNASIRFPDRLRLRVPKGLPAALELAATREHTSPAEWARRALLVSLEAKGIRLHDAGLVEAQS